jgi:chromosome segregation ATPase
MQDMAAKGLAAKEAEKIQHTEYMQWCVDTTRTKKYAIRDGNLAIEKFGAAAEKADADIARLTDEIAELNANIGTWSADKASATKVRDTQHADYVAVHTDLSDSIDAMSRALSMLASRASGAISNSFLQKLTATMPQKARQAVDAYLQSGGITGEEAGDAYQFHTSGIQDMVNNLKDKMSDERATVEKEEAGKKHSFQLLEQQLTMDTEAATDERDQKEELKAQRTEDSAASKGDSGETTATKEADEKYLAETTAMCEQKASEFESRQALRDEEQVALGKAIEIMSGGSVSGAADKHLPALVQKSFALRASKGVAPIQKQVAVFLQGRATKSESRLLQRIAAQVADGPFDKVKKMIEDLIAKLAQEAAEEADHKAWCDGELHSNKNTRDTKSEEVDHLTARSDKLSAQISSLATDIAGLEDEIAAAQAALAEATAQRNKEKAENEEAIKDAKEAIPAVRQAITVLKDFYAKASTATALVQQKQPASWDSSYTGQQSSSTGVVGMLEVILTDFTRLESETSSSEAEAASAFDRFSSDTNADIASLTESADVKGKDKIKKEKDLNDTKKDLRTTQEELDAALAYYDKLKPSCIDAGVSYNERVQRREEEIESLQEALKILGNEM